MSSEAKGAKRVGVVTGVVAAIALALAAGGAAFHYIERAQAAEEGAVAAPQPPSVEIEVIQLQAVRLWDGFSGRLEAVEQVEIRPRVSGTIEQVLLEEGARVQAGELLYVIDPRPFEAEVASARAAFESANSRVQLARVERDRAKELVSKKLISQSQYDAALSEYRVAQAAVSAAKAAVQRAELELEYAHIRAPVSGRISRAEITKGNVVEAGAGAPVLTTIVSDAQMYAEFNVDEATYVRLIRRSQTPGGMPVELQLSGDSEQIYQGRIHAFDNRLDTTTGTIRARALFDNADGVLIPGMYAQIRVGSGAKEEVLLVPERAVGTNQSKKFVYVVTDDNQVAYRDVSLGEVIEGRRVVLAGLKSGDKVMVNSLLRVRPGMAVTPVDVASGEGDTAEQLALR